VLDSSTEHQLTLFVSTGKRGLEVELSPGGLSALPTANYLQKGCQEKRKRLLHTMQIVNNLRSHQNGVCQLLMNKIDEIVTYTLNPHPLSRGVDRDNVTQLLAEYFAMSEFFPYIQAGAHNAVVNRCLEKGEHVPDSCQATSVVGAFLCWDEFGGHSKILTGGLSALPKILDTSDFHAAMLKQNIEQVSPESLDCAYSPITQQYLKQLQQGLSAEDPVERVAYMVAFEMNAERMISGLYESLKNLFPLTINKLKYFEVHVGGDDPAEAYHIDTTSRLIASVVDDTNRGHFLHCFSTACAINRDWCESIKHVSGGTVVRESPGVACPS
jgi:hypothetical protein